MSNLIFWNKQNNNNNNNNNISGSNGNATDAKNGKRNWLHSPDALVNGHVVYLVKFFGCLPVEQAKGIEIVKDAIRKLQFAQQMKKAETGTQDKYKKVEITVSVDGVAVQEPRTQRILHQFPLHNISYCADEKGVKKFFSFIAKKPAKLDASSTTTSTTTTIGEYKTTTTTNGVNINNNFTSNNSSSSSSSSSNNEDSHECFVFISNKLASDITLTIGQAFDLAYRKYMNNAEKSDLAKAQQQINELERIVSIYKNRLREISLKIPKIELDAVLVKMKIKDILEVPNAINNNNNNSYNNAIPNGTNNIKSLDYDNDEKLLIDTSSDRSFVPIVPPRNNLQNQTTSNKSSNSQKMEELLLNSDSDSDFDPRAEESIDGRGNGDTNNSDLFGFEPPKSFGHQLFYNSCNNSNNSENKQQNNNNNNDMNVTPLLAPPPKAAAPRRSTSNPNANNTNGSHDLFGSAPFDINTPSIFQPPAINANKLSSVDDFSLESLDPLRK